MFTLVKRLVRGEEGASMVEYGLLVALIAVACIVAVTTLGGNISTLFTNTAGRIPAGAAS